MSTGVGGVFEFVGGAVVTVSVGVAVGAYYVGKTAAKVAVSVAHDVYGAHKMSEELSKTVIRVVTEQIESNRQEIKRNKMAYESYREMALANETQAEVFKEKLLKNVIVAESFFKQSQIESKLTGLTAAEQISTLEQIALVEAKAQKYQDIYLKYFSAVSDSEEADLSSFANFFELFRNDLFANEVQFIDDMISNETQRLEKYIIDHAEDLKLKLSNRVFEEISFAIEQPLFERVQVIMNDEIRAWLDSDEMASSQLTHEERLASLSNEIRELYLAMIGDEAFANFYSQINNLMDSINRLSTLDNVAIDDRLYELVKRKDELRRIFASLSDEQRSLVNAKREFYLELQKSIELHKLLDIEFQPVKFNHKLADEQVAFLKRENARMNDIYIRQEKRRKALNILKATLAEFAYEYAGEDDTKYMNVDLKEGYFIDKDNNLLMTIISDDSIYYEVAGIDNPLKTIDAQKILESQNNFCGKIDAIKDRLKEQGLHFNERGPRIAPILEDVKEIPIPKGINEYRRQEIMSGRNKKGRTLKEKTI